MTEALWKPHTTVAALCEHDDKFLLVKELVDDRIVYNQPAGHLETGETLFEAVVRETLEETGYQFTPQALQGIYRFRPKLSRPKTYLRFLFRGVVGERVTTALDEGIIAAEWLSYGQVLACQEQHRSPMVMQCIEDFRQRPGYPLDVISREFA